MQQFALNDAEIAHIRDLRSLPDGEKEAILTATHALTLIHPHLALVQPAVVVQFHPRQPVERSQS